MSDSSQTPAAQADTEASESQTAVSPETADSETAETSEAPDPSEPSFGWNTYAERTNGRFAMVGFIALLLLELFTRQDFWSWIGF